MINPALIAASLKIPPISVVGVSPELLLDFGDASTITEVGGVVTAVTDKSAHGRNFAGHGALVREGKALKFNGTDAYLDNSSPFFGSLGGVTVIASARLDGSPASIAVLLAEGSTSSNTPVYQLGVSSTGAFDAFIRTGSGSKADFDSGAMPAFVLPFTYSAAIGAPDLPDSTPGKGFTNTGLARDTDGTWWVGNHGANLPGDVTWRSGVVHLSADFTTVLGEIVLRDDDNAIQVITGITSVQAVVLMPDSTIWIASPNERKLHHITRSGVHLGSITTAKDISGLAYNAATNTLWACDTANLYEIDFSGTFLQSISLAGFSTACDQLFLEENKLWVTNDNGYVFNYDIATGAKSPKYYTPEVRAIEGIYIDRDEQKMYLAEDAYYHGEVVNDNRFVVYNANSLSFGLFVWAENRSTAEMYRNGDEIGAGAISALTSYTVNRMSIGALVRAAVSQYGALTIRQLMIFGTKLTTQQRQIAEGIAAWTARVERDLPSAHPYRHKPPRT